MNAFHCHAATVTARPGTRVLLARHGSTDALGRRLTGRLPGVHLNADGCAQALRLAAELRGLPVSAIYSSPMERATETADPIAAAHGMKVRILPALNEVDFGGWTGAAFQDLSRNLEWKTYNQSRSTAHIPGGESPAATRARVARMLASLHKRHRGGTIVGVTHAELVRYAVLLARDESLDEWHRIPVQPGAVVSLSCDEERVFEEAFVVAHLQYRGLDEL